MKKKSLTFIGGDGNDIHLFFFAFVNRVFFPAYLLFNCMGESFLSSLS